MLDTTIPHKLTELRNKRDERLVRMWDTTKRLRATVKGAFGDDSSEYGLVGGTRMKARAGGPLASRWRKPARSSDTVIQNSDPVPAAIAAARRLKHDRRMACGPCAGRVSPLVVMCGFSREGKSSLENSLVATS